MAYYGRVWMRRGACRILDRGPKANRWEFANAAYTFAHELGHAWGEMNEKKANCMGIRWTKKVAIGLNVKRPYQIRRIAWDINSWETKKYKCKRKRR